MCIIYIYIYVHICIDMIIDMMVDMIMWIAYGISPAIDSVTINNGSNMHDGNWGPFYGHPMRNRNQMIFHLSPLNITTSAYIDLTFLVQNT